MISMRHNAPTMCSIKHSIHLCQTFKIFSMAFKSRSESLHLLTIPEEAYFL